MKKKIPFNIPYTTGLEYEYIRNCLDGKHYSGDGDFTKKCQELLENKFGTHKVLLTTSGTSALEMAAILCDIEPGDEVILPSYTFVSTVNAFLLRGAKPVFVDIRKDTMNIDESLIEENITERTKAIAPVHYAGVSCEMDTILKLAEKYSLLTVEDAAQGVYAKYKDKYLGGICDFGVYSFHETKNFSCGEGGAIIINNEQYVERAEIIREKGTNRSKFIRGQVDKYTWVDIGSSYLISDILAAMLLSQLENMELITNKRKKIFETYMELLKPLGEKGFLQLPITPEECTPNYHMFYILLNSLVQRTKLIDHLKSKNIQSVFHYVPLHTSPMGMKSGYKEGMLPVTEDYSSRLLRLPLYNELDDASIHSVSEEIYNYFGEKL